MRSHATASSKGRSGFSIPIYHMCSYYTPSHCADAIVSLANRSTVVGDVACTLAELAVAWATTGSDYDTLFATTVNAGWVARHRPVLSRGRTGSHTLYTGFNINEPNGQLVQCHQGCGMENQSFTVKPKDVQVVCRQCNSYCTIPKVTSDSSTLLGSRSLVKVAYPPTRFLTEWRLPVDVQSTTQTTGQMPQSTVSTLASGLASTSLGDQASTLGIQLSPPKTVFLAPPPPALTHSTSLPVLHSAFNPHSSEAVLPIPPQVTLPAHHHRQSESTFPVHTPPPTITSQLASRQPRPLTITVPPIARSQSTPQLKRVYPPLELSTASVKRQKKEKK